MFCEPENVIVHENENVPDKASNKALFKGKYLRDTFAFSCTITFSALIDPHFLHKLRKRSLRAIYEEPIKTTLCVLHHANNFTSRHSVVR